MTPHLKAVLQALLVTFLWSTSWVLIKIGLVEIPALTFAGLRYSLAFLFLLAWGLRSRQVYSLRKITFKNLSHLVVLGVLFYTLTQGAQFLGLAYLPAVTINLLLSFTSIIVAILGSIWLNEQPTGWQWLGITLSITGALIFFYPVDLAAGEIIGYTAVIVGLLANAISSLLGRQINQRGDLSPLNVTLVSMGIGGIVLLILGIGIQGLPPLNIKSWLLIFWLALINTAFAFSLWNLTLKTLPAMESSIINNTMMMQIPILAVLFLGETLSGKEWGGMVIAGIGVIFVQIFRKKANQGK